MKIGITSILLALIGIIFVIWFNLQTSELFYTELMKMRENSDLTPPIVTNVTLYKLIAIGIGLLGLFHGIKSVRSRNRIGIIGIALSILLLILSFLPIWQYFLSDSALDINFVN